MLGGDRSHPRLVLLDSMKENLTYDDWMVDLQKAEMLHLESHAFVFPKTIQQLKNKQALHAGGSFTRGFAVPKLVGADIPRL